VIVENPVEVVRQARDLNERSAGRFHRGPDLMLT
jgi:hypothetical protein